MRHTVRIPQPVENLQNFGKIECHLGRKLGISLFTDFSKTQFLGNILLRFSIIINQRLPHLAKYKKKFKISFVAEFSIVKIGDLNY